jgi:benzoate 4-monooxygenase
MTYNLQELVKQWDRLSSTAIGGGRQWAEMDCLHWFNYLAFDIIGDLVRAIPKNPQCAIPICHRR